VTQIQVALTAIDANVKALMCGKLASAFKWTEVISNTSLTAMSRDSAVGIATGYRLDDRGVGLRVAVGSRIFSSLRCPDRLWGSPNLVSSGYRRLFPQA
jgi:hypothetical protein